MARKKKVNDYGTGIPYHEVEALARVLLPEIQAFFESEEGQREYAEWKVQQATCKSKQEYQARREYPQTMFPPLPTYCGIFDIRVKYLQPF